jgi:hypothetical protein
LFIECSFRRKRGGERKRCHPRIAVTCDAIEHLWMK